MIDSDNPLSRQVSIFKTGNRADSKLVESRRRSVRSNENHYTEYSHERLRHIMRINSLFVFRRNPIRNVETKTKRWKHVRAVRGLKFIKPCLYTKEEGSRRRVLSKSKSVNKI